MKRGKIIQNWADFFSYSFRHSNIAVVGGGGKTGLIGLMADELQSLNKAALVTVTTRLGREQLPQLKRVEAVDLGEAKKCLERVAGGERLLLAGPFASREKLAGAPPEWFPALRRAGGAEITFLIEADGAAGRPLKAHRQDEPVLPPLNDLLVVGVLGLSALLFPWPQVTHRPEILAGHIRLPADNEALSPRLVADFINSAWKRFKPDIIFLNQADLLRSAGEKYLSGKLADDLAADGWTVFTGSLKELADRNGLRKPLCRSRGDAPA